MNSTFDRLYEDALSLSEGERLELAEALIASLSHQDRPPFDDSWGAIVEKRSQELLSGEKAPVLWSEVKRKSQEQTGG